MKFIVWTIAVALASANALRGEDPLEDTNTTYRSPWEVESKDDSSGDDAERWTTSTSILSSLIYEEREKLFPRKDDDVSALDSRPTRKVYGIDNRGDRELYPELIIEPSIYDRYEVYETDRDGLKKWEPKAIIKQGVYDRYEVYKTDRDGLAVNEPSLIIEEGLHGDQKIYKTDRYGMREDIPSRVIKTDSLGRQKVYRTDRYGMPIGDPIDEKIIE